ncbi:SRPBCC family protein [Adhaeribacter radiodurans]|uniref:SRPBCC domain-containing protein n=1 Tax=Adhaeribacter radiodurans TaxID=2745197 RepID=A0A7L7LDT2_9BACT|nr:SRPBCC domain-containing protein [Adhaeribacter radiodurans]QMU30917.1 SRPBCC domain-containing protein [Adhaeribacter radiodurans]
MENFDWSSFTKRIAVKSSLSEIYDAWTKPRELEKWFLKKVNFFNSDKTSFEYQVNVLEDTLYEWFWYLYDEPMKGRITSVNGKDFIQFTFEGECLVDVNLEEIDEYVIVTLRHHNIPLDNNSKQYVRLGCSNGWAFYLTNLKSIYEGGLDLRNKDEKLRPMINN